jgi:hypothetical protein
MRVLLPLTRIAQVSAAASRTSLDDAAEKSRSDLSPQAPRRGEVDVERSEASGEGYSDDLEGEVPSPGALRAADLSLRPPRRGEERHLHLSPQAPRRL